MRAGGRIRFAVDRGAERSLDSHTRWLVTLHGRELRVNGPPDGARWLRWGMRQIALAVVLLSTSLAYADELPKKDVAADVGIEVGLASHPNGDTGTANDFGQTDSTLGASVAVGYYVLPTMAVMLDLRGTFHPGSSGFYKSGFVGAGLRLAVTEHLAVQPAVGFAGAMEAGDYGTSATGPAVLARAETTWGAFAFGLEAMSIFGTTTGYASGQNLWVELALTAGFTH